MPVPKRKRSRSRRDKRFANKGIKPQLAVSCTQCSEPIRAHQACLSCGYYKGVKVLNTKADRSIKRADNKKDIKNKTGTPQNPIVEEKAE